MDVRIDPARHHDLPGRVDNPCGTIVREAPGSANRGNPAAADGEIDLVMGQIGCPSLDQLGPDFLWTDDWPRNR